jgi:DNA-binding Xre family transcriptional regulator
VTVRLNTKAVKTRAAEMDITMRDLATAADIGEATMYRITNGAGFNLETLGKLADALKLNPIDLLDIEGFPPPLVGASTVGGQHAQA